MLEGMLWKKYGQILSIFVRFLFSLSFPSAFLPTNKIQLSLLGDWNVKQLTWQSMYLCFWVSCCICGQECISQARPGKTKSEIYHSKSLDNN